MMKRSSSRRSKAVKKIKLENKAKIRRRLFKLWSQKVMLLNDNLCAVTGAVRGSVVDGKTVILDAHHLEGRAQCQYLRFDPLNGIALSKKAHKFGKDSAHRGSLWFCEWLRINRPKQHAYVLAHRDDVIDLEDRDVLYAIEAKLLAPMTNEERDIIGMPPLPSTPSESQPQPSSSDTSPHQA
jgi:hypothetical protein